MPFLSLTNLLMSGKLTVVPKMGGPDKTSDTLLQEYGYWYGELSRQHTRQRKANTRTKPHYQRYLNQLRN